MVETKNLTVMLHFHFLSLFFHSQSLFSHSSMKRPAPQHASKRRVPPQALKQPIPGLIGPDSFGSNNEIWGLLTEAGIIPQIPLCPHCLPEKVPLPLLCRRGTCSSPSGAAAAERIHAFLTEQTCFRSRRCGCSLRPSKHGCLENTRKTWSQSSPSTNSPVNGTSKLCAT